MTDDEVQAIVVRVLSQKTSEAGFEGADVKSVVDYDGEPVIRVTARYKRNPISNPNLLIDSVHAVRAALIACGDDRFVLLTNDIETERTSEPLEVD